MDPTRICVFTDSRGQYRPTPTMTMFHEDLGDGYDVVRYEQPHKWTTIPDFLTLVRDGTIVPSQFDYVVLWAGVVDFSPRPFRSCYRELLGGADRNMVSNIPNRTAWYSRTINKKLIAIDRLVRNRFVDQEQSLDDMEWAFCPPYAVSYNGEPTASLYSEEFVDVLASELNAIPNLIFIDTCGIHPNWDGNFDKGRPRNMTEVVRYNDRLTSQLRCPIIRQSDWSEEELVARTIDSMHVNQEGSDKIRDDLLEIIEADRKTARSETANFILSATDATFFPTTLAMVESAFEHSAGSIDGIAVLDIGMKPSQRSILENLRGVHVFDYREEDRKVLSELDVNFLDPKTYGFKVYLTTKAPELIRERVGNIEDLRLLYVDGGILINRDLSDIFRKIAADGIFCVDHDECRDLYGFRAFLFNILSPQLYSDGVFEKLSLAKLAKPYIKAGFFGYAAGGKYQHIVDELWSMSVNTKVLAAPKACTDDGQRTWYVENTGIKQHVEKKYGSGERLILDYIGSRQDQTALSYLVAKHGAPISNSRDYNFTVSTGSGRTGWEGIVKRLSKDRPECKVDLDRFWSEHNEKDNRATKAHLIPIPDEAKSSMTILHRGALVDEDIMKNAGRLMNRARNLKNDTFILLGNGPSLGEVDLKTLAPYSTFGLNAAYRAYERMGFWPTYFGCFDAVVCGHHSEKFKELIKDSPIERFFFINYNEKKQPNFPEPEIQASPKFANINFVERTVPEKERTDIISMTFDPFIDMLTSGSNAVQCALLMGYRKIVLLGCDANYVEVVEGASHESNRNRLKMDKTPDSNPNYWFADYQQEGDRFNVPNTQGCQLPAWTRLADTIGDLGINAEIINCSPISKIDVFKKMPLADALEYFDKLDVAKIGEEATPVRRAKPLSVSTKARSKGAGTNAKVGRNSSDASVLYTDKVPGPVEMLRALEESSKAPAVIAPAPIAAPSLDGAKPQPAQEKQPAPAASSAEPSTSAPTPTPAPAASASATDTKAIVREPAGSPRMAKLRRDPHLFFADSKSPLLRPLRFLFRPTGRTRAQVALRESLKADHGGMFSWLPASRLTMAQQLHELEHRSQQALSSSIASVRSQLTQVRTEMATANQKTGKEIRDKIARLNDQLSGLREEIELLKEEKGATAQLLGEFEQRALESAREHEQTLAALRHELDESLTANDKKLLEIEANYQAGLEALTKEHSAEKTATLEAVEAHAKVLKDRLETEVVAARTKAEAVEHRLQTNLKAFTEAEERRNKRLDDLESATSSVGQKLSSAQSKFDGNDSERAKQIALLRERVSVGEQQIGKMRFTDVPQTLVLFGHHKCGSRLFRNEIFNVVAESTGAVVHSYKVKNPPFHYSRGEELDLCNMDFDAIGKNDRDVVLFSNATDRSLGKLDRTTTDWRGVRIIRDPRQVLVSNYFHHKGDHKDEHNGWVYDQLKIDKPILRELPQEKGLLHELDHISKDIIETQILASFDDERVMTVKLEDFAAAPKAWLQRMAEFLRVPDIAGVDLSRTFANPSSRSWESVFTTRLRKEFKERYGEALIDLGYAKDMDW